MSSLAKLRVKIFADGADRVGMLDLYRNPIIKGFATNATLMRSAGITDYEAFARDIVTAIPFRSLWSTSRTTSLRWRRRDAGSPPVALTST
jgi:transaldolase